MRSVFAKIFLFIICAGCCAAILSIESVYAERSILIRSGLSEVCAGEGKPTTIAMHVENVESLSQPQPTTAISSLAAPQPIANVEVSQVQPPISPTIEASPDTPTETSVSLVLLSGIIGFLVGMLLLATIIEVVRLVKQRST